MVKKEKGEGRRGRDGYNDETGRCPTRRWPPTRPSSHPIPHSVQDRRPLCQRTDRGQRAEGATIGDGQTPPSHLPIAPFHFARKLHIDRLAYTSIVSTSLRILVRASRPPSSPVDHQLQPEPPLISRPLLSHCSDRLHDPPAPRQCQTPSERCKRRDGDEEERTRGWDSWAVQSDD